MEKIYFECECGSTQHLVKFDRDENCVVLYIQLNEWGTSYKRFFRRTWEAIKYTFGFQNRWGVWEEVWLNTDKVKQLIKFLEEHVNDSKDK